MNHSKQFMNLRLPAQQRLLTHGLLAHSTLVCVPGRLVVVGVGNEARTHSEQREGLNLQVRRFSKEMNTHAVTDKTQSLNISSVVFHVLADHVFIKGDLTVVLLIHIQVLHEALVQEVFECSGFKVSGIVKLAVHEAILSDHSETQNLKTLPAC